MTERRPAWPQSLSICMQRLAEFAIAAVLFWSGAAHLKNPFAFLTSIVRYQIVDGMPAAVLAAVLPVFQTVLAGVLVVGFAPGCARFLTALLMTVFVGVQGSAVVRGLEIGCGCFGIANEVPVTWGSVIRVTSLAMLAWGLFWRSRVDARERISATVSNNVSELGTSSHSPV